MSDALIRGGTASTELAESAMKGDVGGVISEVSRSIELAPESES